MKKLISSSKWIFPIRSLPQCRDHGIDSCRFRKIFIERHRMRLFKSFKRVTVASAVISVICALTGLLISIWQGTPVGSTIAAADVAAFGICYLAGRLQGR